MAQKTQGCPGLFVGVSLFSLSFLLSHTASKIGCMVDSERIGGTRRMNVINRYSRRGKGLRSNIGKRRRSIGIWQSIFTGYRCCHYCCIPAIIVQSYSRNFLGLTDIVRGDGPTCDNRLIRPKLRSLLLSTANEAVHDEMRKVDSMGGGSFRVRNISRASTNATVTVEQKYLLVRAVCGCSYPVSDIDEVVYSGISTLIPSCFFCYFELKVMYISV